MSIESFAQPHRWTIRGWAELNAQSAGPRFDLIGGAFLVTPSATWAHQWAGDSLGRVLFAALPSRFRVATAVGVVLRPGGSAITPDLVVARRQTDGAHLHAGDVVLAAEIVAPATPAADRRIRPSEYAGAGIPHFWRVELSPFEDQGADALPVLFTYALDNGRYQLTHRIAAGTRAVISEPFRVELDPATLVES